MEPTIVDQLLILLFDQAHNVPMAMRAAGHTQDEISEAWRKARTAGYTESTGLGMDRLTPAGRARALDIRYILGGFQGNPPISPQTRLGDWLG